MRIKTLAAAFGITLSLMAYAQAQDPFTDGLVSYYPFSSNGNDAAGQNPLILSNIVFGDDRFGNSNACIVFDENISRWCKSQNIVAANVMDHFTVTLWANLGGKLEANKSTGGSMLLMASHGTASYGSGHAGVGIQAGTNGVAIWEHADGYVRYPVTVLTNLSGWTQIGVVYSNRVPSVFINGKLAATGTANLNYHYHPSSGQTLTTQQWFSALNGGLGLMNTLGSSFSFKGAIDEFRIFSRALASSEIHQLYACEALPFVISIGMHPGVTVSGVVGHSYAIQYTTDLTKTNDWSTAETITLAQPRQLWVDVAIDTTKSENPRRFYRAIPSQ